MNSANFSSFCTHNVFSRFDQTLSQHRKQWRESHLKDEPKNANSN